MIRKPTNRRQFVRVAASCVGLPLAATSSVQSEPRENNSEFDVRLYGAKGDGLTFDTPAIQAAIDACAKAQSGRVVLRAGVFLTKTLILKSNVTFFIDSGAILQGTANLNDYSEIETEYVCYTYSKRVLIHAEGADNIAILGKGVIDLNGIRFPKQSKHTDLTKGVLEWGESPLGVRLVKTNNVTIRDVTFRNSPMVALRLEAAIGVVIEGIRIENRVRIGCDGLELVSCQDVQMSNCHIDSWDDAICLKSASPDFCRNITISNCTVSSLCNAIKLGTESNGGFENITITNCTIQGGEMNGWQSINGIALMIVDGGTMNRINIANIVMTGTRTAIFVHLGDRGRRFSPLIPVEGIGTVKNIFISNVIGEVVGGEYCCSITGLPEKAIENIVVKNIRLRTPGGQPAILAERTVPEKPKDYPESIMFGALPAYGFFCRHVKGMVLQELYLETETADFRPAIFCDDVEDISITALEGATSGDEPFVRLTSARNVLLQNCRPRGRTFVAIYGIQSAEIALVSNDLRHVQLPVKKADGFDEAVIENGNLKSK